MSDSVHLDVIEDFSRLLEIRREWDSLVARTQGLTPFQLPLWLIPWWQHFGSGKLRCFAFHCSNQLVGLIPCFVHEWNGARQITLIGAGISDYLEPVIQPEYARAIVNQISRHLEVTTDWDVCHWQDLSFNTPWRGVASEIAEAQSAGLGATNQRSGFAASWTPPLTPRPFCASASEDAPCMEIRLKGSFDAYWESCGRGLRQNVRRDRTKAEARGKLSFEVTREADQDLLDGLIEMHRERWQKKNESGMIEANKSADFLREIARDFAAVGLLRIFALRFEERGSQAALGSAKLVAVILAFSYGGRMSNYLTGFDPAYERLGFGRTLLYEALRYCFENNYEVWDFLRGDEPYKKLWRAEIVPKTRVVVNRTTRDTAEPFSRR